MTQKQSWSRAQNVCDKVSQHGATGVKSRRIMRKISTTKEMKSRYTRKNMDNITHKQCKKMVRSDIAAIDKKHKKEMRAKWNRIPKKDREPFRKWLKSNSHANPIDMGFKEDVEYLFNSE